MIDASPVNESASPPVVNAASPFGWFAYLWPIAVLFHLGGNDFHLVNLTPTGVFQIPFAIAAIAMLIRPSARRALILALSHLPVVLIKLPQVGNHEILLLLIHLTVVLAVTSRRKDWIAAAAPVMRWILLIGYSAIAFSKLNSSFVDRAVSCAVIFGDEFADWVNVSVSHSAALSTMVIAITLAAELSIPVLLMIRGLRRYGVALGLVFHTLLALEPNGHVFDFTSVLFILFLLFLAPDASDRLRQKVEDKHRSLGTLLILALVAVMALGNLVTFRMRSQGVAIPQWLFDYPLWIAYAAFLLRAVLPSTRAKSATSQRVAMRIAPVMSVVLLLTSLNAASPYLELRTAGAFNMYSNLSTFDGDTNHYLLPGTLPLRRTPDVYQYIPNPETAIGLDFYAADGFLLPHDNLARWARIYPSIDADLIRVGDDHSVTNSDSLEGDIGGWDLLVQRVLYIRAIDPVAPTSCRRYWGPAH